MIDMVIIDEIYGNVLNDKFNTEIEIYQSRLLGITDEELSFKRSEIINEVLGNNYASTLRILREEVIYLNKLREMLNTKPLLADVRILCKYQKENVDEAIKELKLAILGSEEQ